MTDVENKKTDADIVRDLLKRACLGQREAARDLEISERDMRGYCAGHRVPRYVLLALERLVQVKEDGKWIA
jgi:hypothetical protein